jgi:hypothetical protein
MLARLRRSFAVGLTAAALTLTAPSAQAWNAAGHRLVAAIAWQEMSPTARRHAALLLQQHPDYRKWTPRSQQDWAEADFHAFVECSTWADEIRHDRRFHDEDEQATPLLPGFPEMGRHGHWHFLNLDVAAMGRDDGKGELEARLEQLQRQLADSHYTYRPYVLPWLVHLVADLHQPLHVGGRNDAGGNAVTVFDPRRRPPEVSLHAWWDQLGGPPSLRGRALDTEVVRLRRTYPQLSAGGSVRSWRDESYRLARDQAYPPGRGEVLRIDEGWRRQAEVTSDRRLLEAGLRLGDLLNRLLSR